MQQEVIMHEFKHPNSKERGFGKGCRTCRHSGPTAMAIRMQPCKKEDLLELISCMHISSARAHVL